MLLDTRPQPPEQPKPSPHPSLHEIVDPTTGEILDAKDADALITSFERVDKHYRELGDFRRRLAYAIGDLTDASDDRRTRRVRGKVRQAKVEMPEEGWNQGILKEAWNSYPLLRDEFLRIDTVAVRKREWKKLEGTKGPPDLEQFKSMVTKAVLPPGGTPRITVEK